jgi:MOSC domain-containing protein YiiM
LINRHIIRTCSQQPWNIVFDKVIKLISVNVGLPQGVESHGKVVRTSIWKKPVVGRVRAATLNLEGDRQSDLSVHGGVYKAVYAYPSEHYSYWRNILPDNDLPWGAFGENFTIEGLLENDVRIGDRFQIGSAEFMVTQPRMPCYKLGIRFNRTDIIKLFLQSKRSGFYFSVLREGEVEAGDPIHRVFRPESALTIPDIVNLYAVDSENQELLRSAIESPALPESWKEYFRKRLWDADV